MKNKNLVIFSVIFISLFNESILFCDNLKIVENIKEDIKNNSIVSKIENIFTGDKKEDLPVNESLKNNINVEKVNNNYQYQCKSYADLVEKLLPAVVNISVTGVEEITSNPLEQMFGNNPMMNDQILKEFFGKRNTIKRKVSALGSGFFIDKNGYLVSNYHVVKDAQEIIVTTQDQEQYKAKIISFDKKTDLVVLKIKSKNKTPFVKFGNSATLRIGDPVIAIGNPFNLGSTVTSGIVSAKSRKIGGAYDDFIQIDASINMGNSGGPTFDMNGEVIGINTAILSPSGGNIGLGFAIAADMAEPIIEKLKQGKVIKRGMLGVIVQNVTQEMGDAVGLDKPEGAFVNDVNQDSPAQKAGIQKGDVIMKFNGKKIKEFNDLPMLVGNTEIGTKADIEILRYGKKMHFTTTIEDRLSMDGPEEDILDKKDEDVNGIVVRTLSKIMKEKMKLPNEIDGLLVVKVKNDNLMPSDGVNAGDIIMQINDTKITKIEDLKSALKNVQSNKKKSFIFYIYRGGTSIVNGVDIG